MVQFLPLHVSPTQGPQSPFLKTGPKLLLKWSFLWHCTARKKKPLFQLRIRPSLISTMAKDHPLYRLGGWVTKSNVLPPKVSVILTITTQQFSLKSSCLWIENLLRSHDSLFNNLFNVIFFFCYSLMIYILPGSYRKEAVFTYKCIISTSN